MIGPEVQAVALVRFRTDTSYVISVSLPRPVTRPSRTIANSEYSANLSLLAIFLPYAMRTSVQSPMESSTISAMAGIPIRSVYSVFPVLTSTTQIKYFLGMTPWAVHNPLTAASCSSSYLSRAKRCSFGTRGFLVRCN